MKEKISIIFAAVAIIAVMAVNFQVSNDNNILGDINLKVLAQNALAEEEGGPGGGGDGCYKVHTLACFGGIYGSQQVHCNFTGVWGAPYACTSISCWGGTTDRRCVRPN